MAVPVSERPDEQIVERLKILMIDHSLPLWAHSGWDSVRGGFVERLNAAGNADELAPRRVRVQARQIYCFAKAAQLGWYPQGREVSIRGLEYLLAKAKSPDGEPGFVHLLNADGSVLDPLRDSYDHAFVLLALATVYQLVQEAEVQEEIKSLVGFLDDHMKSPYGGVLEGIPSRLPRRQNPQMHLFEAMIATFDSMPFPIYRDRADGLFQLFISKLYDQQRQTLGEYFENDWSKIEPAIVEPGHQAEWVWLLKAYERISSCSTAQYRSQLLASALRYRDNLTSCLIDEGDSDAILYRAHGTINSIRIIGRLSISSRRRHSITLSARSRRLNGSSAKYLSFFCCTNGL